MDNQNYAARNTFWIKNSIECLQSHDDEKQTQMLSLNETFRWSFVGTFAPHHNNFCGKTTLKVLSTVKPEKHANSEGLVRTVHNSGFNLRD